MFDIGSSELILIAVVALIAIGPKELPGVLRMVGQWTGKARKMAAEFQGQFQEAMREAEMADLKKGFDEIKEATTSFSRGNLLTSLQKDVNDALNVDKPAERPSSVTSEPSATSGEAHVMTSGTPAAPTMPEAPPAIIKDTEAHGAAAEPLAITPEIQSAPGAESVPHDAPQGIAPTEERKDAKAS